jgi:hypothetical protein
MAGEHRTARPAGRGTSMSAGSAPMRMLAVVLAVSCSPALADEGMWPFEMAPVEAVRRDHGVELTKEWLDHAMRAAVRFNNGGSGSFVSRDGLVLTNHHVGADCIAKLSTVAGGADAMKEGYVARSMEEERKCPDLELNVLQQVDDVTAKVEAAAANAKTDAERNAAKKGEMSKLEKACTDATGRRCDVVTLYGGGAYHLYQYQKYTDVRLAFAPEFQIAFFGGDPDNFTFPRADLDMAIFRVYQDDKPVRVQHYLKFSPRGPREGETVFVAGHPGSTDRFTVVGKMELLRDVTYPFVLAQLEEERQRLKAYMAKGEAEERAARDAYFGIENSLKAIKGYLRGLTDAALMAKAKQRQQQLLQNVARLPEPERARLAEAFPKLEAAYRSYGAYARELNVLERRYGPHGMLIDVAKLILRSGDELPKKNEDRLRELRESNLQSLELQLFSDAPVVPGFEVEQIALGLENMVEVLGAKDKTVKAVLAGKTPRARAEEVVAGTKLGDVAVRKALYQGGKKAIDAAKDPLLEMVRAYDAAARKVRKRYEDEVEGAEKSYAGRVAEANAKAFGTSVYPDATFTLRLSTGVVKGYVEDGKPISWRTQFGDLYRKHKRAGGKDPYALPPRWIEKQGVVDFATTYDFVSTNDIIGGNSGSPVFDRDLKLVGLIFDGNIQSLGNRFVYDETEGRAVSVASNGMLHALDRVYGAKSLVDELLAN